MYTFKYDAHVHALHLNMLAMHPIKLNNVLIAVAVAFALVIAFVIVIDYVATVAAAGVDAVVDVDVCVVAVATQYVHNTGDKYFRLRSRIRDRQRGRAVKRGNAFFLLVGTANTTCIEHKVTSIVD